MRGTLISILVGALAGTLLTLGTSVHASRAAANRGAPGGSSLVAPRPVAPEVASRTRDARATRAEQGPLTE